MPRERYTGIRRFVGEDGCFYFGIIARNGQTLATSEGYEREEEREKGIRSAVRAVARYAGGGKSPAMTTTMRSAGHG